MPALTCKSKHPCLQKLIYAILYTILYNLYNLYSHIVCRSWLILKPGSCFATHQR